jgi:outer membrane protein assembly factor BamD
MRSLIVVLWIGAVACGRAAPGPVSPETQLVHARALVRQGKFAKALPLLQRLVFELPPGHAAVPEMAHLTGEALFQTGDFAEAARQFRQVAEQYPQSPFAPLSLLRAGDAHLRMWRKPQLDPTFGEVALAVYQELTGRYPESEAAARAGLHVRRLRAWFAEKTYRNGMFYLRRKAYDSAIIYFRSVVASWSETPHAPAALLRLVDAYRAIRYDDEVRETCEHLQRFYPRIDGLAERCPPAAAPSVGASP